MRYEVVVERVGIKGDVMQRMHFFDTSAEANAFVAAIYEYCNDNDDTVAYLPNPIKESKIQ